MSTQYKYKTSIVIGHSPDGKPVRKYIQDNSKARFDAKVRAVKALTDRGGAPGRTTVEQWAWQWYRSYKEPRVGPSQRKTYETAHPPAHLPGHRRAADHVRQALPDPAARQRGADGHRRASGRGHSCAAALHPARHF